MTATKEILDIVTDGMLRYSTRDLASTSEVVDMLLDIQAIIIADTLTATDILGE